MHDLGHIDPQAQAILDAAVGRPGPVDIPETHDFVKAKRMAAWAMSANDEGPSGAAEPVSVVEELTIETLTGTIPARLYRTAAVEQGPTLVWFHGGGFIAGDLDTHDKPMRAIANRCAATVVSVEYRLAPEFQYPAALEDAYAAVLWASRRATELGSENCHIVVGGDSSGGQLAATVAIMARDTGGPIISHQILVYPNVDLRLGNQYGSWKQYQGIIVSRRDMDRMISLYLPEGADASTALVSPLLASDAELAGLPPALVITGEFDPLRDEGEAYAQRLAAAGVPVKRTRYPGMIHGFMRMLGKVDAGRQLIQQIADTVDAVHCDAPATGSLPGV